MLRFLFKLLICFVIMAGIAFIGINLFLDPISNWAMNSIVENMPASNLLVSGPAFRHARISSYNAVAWEDFRLTATLVSNDSKKRSLKASINVEELKVKAAKPLEGLFIIELKGLSISPEYISGGASQAQDAPEAVQEANLTAQLRLDLTTPGEIKSRIKGFASEMRKFLEEGKTSIPVEFSAEEIITIGDNVYAVSLRTEHRGENYHLVANRDDIRFLSESILPSMQTSTAADLEIIAINPAKAPQLLRIRSKAFNSAASTHAQDPRVPEDAYRHVLWSFLLAREYGAEFAKEVTDAHEFAGDLAEKSNPGAAAYHRQDYINNEAGRRFAAMPYNESDILHLVMTDPRVMRMASGAGL
jgi:hypothetical protein